MSPSVVKDKGLARGESRGMSSNASTADPIGDSVQDLRTISENQSDWNLWAGSRERQFSSVTNDTVTSDRLIASSGVGSDRLMASTGMLSSSAIGEYQSSVAEEDRVVKRSSSQQLGPTHEGGKYVTRRRRSQTANHPRANSPVRDMVVRVGLSHMFRMSELVKLGDMLQEEGYRTVESMKYLDDMTIHKLGIPPKLAYSLQSAPGVAPYQKYGRVEPLPTGTPRLDAVSPGRPNPWRKQALVCEMHADRDLPTPVDHMNGFPSALRDYGLSPERARPTSTSKVRRERSVEVHVERQASARRVRQESQERSPVRDPWMESTFNRKSGATTFGTSSVRSIAGYDNPARCRQMAGEVAPTLTDRGRFSWLQDQERSFDEIKNLRDKLYNSSVVSSPLSRRHSTSNLTPYKASLGSPAKSVPNLGGRGRISMDGRDLQADYADFDDKYEAAGHAGHLSPRIQEDVASAFADGTSAGGSMQHSVGGSLRTPRTFSPYDSSEAVSPKTGPSTATEPATVWTPQMPQQLPQPVLPQSMQYGGATLLPVQSDPQAQWLSSADVAQLMQGSLQVPVTKTAEQQFGLSPRYGAYTPKSVNGSDLSASTRTSTPARPGGYPFVHPPASSAVPLQTYLSPRAAANNQVKRRPAEASPMAPPVGMPAVHRELSPRSQPQPVRPTATPVGMQAVSGTIQAPFGIGMHPAAPAAPAAMVRGRSPMQGW